MIEFNGIKEFNLINTNFVFTKNKESKKELNCIDEYYHLKCYFIEQISSLGYNFVIPTENKFLVETFYNTVIRLLVDLDMNENQLNYYKKNLVRYKPIHSRYELVQMLENEKLNFKQNDSRFYLGFRSITYILLEKIDELSHQYIKEIFDMLLPFFEYKTIRKYDLNYHF